MLSSSVLLPSSTSPVLSLRADLVRLPSRLLSARFMLSAGLDVAVTCIATQPGVPSSGGSSLRALWVASPRSRHRPLLLDLRRLSFPTPHILQCVVLELNCFLCWSLLVFVLGWKPSLFIARARWLDLSLWWLLCSLSSTSSSYLRLRIDHGVPRAARNTSVPWLPSDCSSKKCPLPRRDRMHTHVAFLMKPNSEHPR